MILRFPLGKGSRKVITFLLSLFSKCNCDNQQAVLKKHISNTATAQERENLRVENPQKIKFQTARNCIHLYPVKKYMLIVSNRNSTKRYKICSRWYEWRNSGVFIVKSENISQLFLVFLLLNLKCPLFWCSLVPPYLCKIVIVNVCWES